MVGETVPSLSDLGSSVYQQQISSRRPGFCGRVEEETSPARFDGCPTSQPIGVLSMEMSHMIGTEPNIFQSVY